MFEKPPHGPHEPKVVVPQPVPSVFRVHSRLSMERLAEQDPASQVKTATTRLWVPVLSHTLLNAAHVLHAPATGGPQSSSIMHET